MHVKFESLGHFIWLNTEWKHPGRKLCYYYYSYPVILLTDKNMNINWLFFLQAGALPKGAKVEIEAIAMVGEIVDENL